MAVVDVGHRAGPIIGHPVHRVAAEPQPRQAGAPQVVRRRSLDPKLRDEAAKFAICCHGCCHDNVAAARRYRILGQQSLFSLAFLLAFRTPRPSPAGLLPQPLEHQRWTDTSPRDPRRRVVVIGRENGKRGVVVTASVHCRDIASLVAEAQASIAEGVQLPAGYWITGGGQFENLIAARQRLILVCSHGRRYRYQYLFDLPGDCSWRGRWPPCPEIEAETLAPWSMSAVFYVEHLVDEKARSCPLTRRMTVALAGHIVVPPLPV